MQTSSFTLVVFSLAIFSTWLGREHAHPWHKDSRPSRCEEPLDSGRCTLPMLAYYFNVSSGLCEEFISGGCGSNNNNFLHLEDCIWECERFDILPRKCKLRLQVGIGTDFVQKYYYDSKTRKCKTFIYKGSRGNLNNFPDLHQCNLECGLFVPMPRKCTCQKSPGYCFKAIPRYFYNPKSNKCEQFLYSGCSGNGNRFVKKADCIRECKSYVPL